MQTLRSYLEGRPKAKFAEQVGISPVYLSQLLSRHRRPSLALMQRIQEATEGQVDLNSWSLSEDHSSDGHATVKRKGRAA